MSFATDLTAHYRAVSGRLNDGSKVRLYARPIGPEMPVLDFRLVRSPTLGVPAERLPAFETSRNVREIIQTVCDKHGVSVTDVMSERRMTKVVRARQEAIYLVRKATLWSLPRIGRHFGGRDHTTVLYSVRCYAARNGLPA